MSEYQLKHGKIGEAVTGAYKKVEDSFVDAFLEKDEDGESMKLKTGKVGDAVVGAYKAVEDTVVGGYKAIEGAVVGGYKKIEDAFVDRFLEKSADKSADGCEAPAQPAKKPGIEKEEEEG